MIEEREFRDLGCPWPLRGSQSFDYDSRAVGDRLAIGVWAPPKAHLERGGAKDAPLDLVYVLDASWKLGIAASLCYLQYVDRVNPGFAPVLLVGVDYPVDRTNARTRDYTMADAVPVAMVDKAAAPELTPGGADKFLEFLEDELDPFIRSRYPVADRPAGILGNSYGGTFTFYAFLRQSRLFDRYWLGSPGLFTTGTDHVAQVEARLKGDLVHPTKMFLSIGSLEIDGGFAIYEDLGRHFTRLVDALKRTPNRQLQWTSKIYDGYTHTSVLAPAINDALLRLYGSKAPI